ELLELLASYTAAIGREISVYIKRNGVVVDVSIGDAATVSMPNMRVVRNEDRLCGVRCIHTHPNGSARLSDVDLGTLRTMRLDCMAALGVQEGKPTALFAGYIGEWNDAEGYTTPIYGPMQPMRLPQRALMREIYAADERLKTTTAQIVSQRPERAILVGLESDAPYDTIAELGELAKTAGAEVAAVSIQRRKIPDNATYIGSGKAEELSLQGSALEADLFIFDDELSAVQLRNLENLLGRPVIDRTTLILDIFAARAQTREGKLQVELAQQQYRLPRLAGEGVALSRLGGGIGTRGPGEKKLEIDRRRIRRRIYELQQELEEIEKQRKLRRERRKKNAVPLVALVGYTNAGKSTLLNALSGSDVLAEDMLFATLDPVVRKVTLPNGTETLFSDTVGFIGKLPHELVRAFHATLEEVTEADLILHVVDCTSSYYDAQMHVVEDVLATLGAADTPRINVYNKTDMEAAAPNDRGRFVHISAKTGGGMAQLLEETERLLTGGQVKASILVPYSRYDVMNTLRSLGRILEEEHQETGTRVSVLLPEEALARVHAMLK
ncbi:MAG: GTPase HflX, partial [Eubacteriales bacterium]|nr:GTPase HflX [Eubacteriales bacterium]